MRNDGVLLPGRKNRGLPTLLRSRSMDRYETVVAVYLRRALRLADLAGDQSAYLDYAELEEFALALPAVEVANKAEFRDSLRKALLGPGSFGSQFVVRTDQQDRYRIRRAIATVMDHRTLTDLLAELTRQSEARVAGQGVSEINASGPRASVDLRRLTDDQPTLELDPQGDDGGLELSEFDELDPVRLDDEQVPPPDGAQP